MTRSVYGWDYPPGAEHDPMAPYNQVDEGDYGLEDLRAWLRKESTGRWEWEKIDYCYTGKDADISPWGQQGVEVVSCDDGEIECMAYLLKTAVGNDICLNTLEGISDEEYEKAREEYMETAEALVQGCGLSGEWDGDDWILLEKNDFTVPWVLGKDGVPDIEATGKAIIAKGEEVLAPIEKLAVELDKLLEEAAGWAHETNK
jgi:hypothetical protein